MTEFSMADPARWARSILDANSYMVLATADEAGRPWASPVWYAHHDYREFFWLSSPEARHSQNVAVRPEIAIVVFDSRVRIGTGQGVYMRAVASEVSGDDLDSALSMYSARSAAQGGMVLSRADLEGPGIVRLFRAVALEYSMLAKDGQPDHRVIVDVR